MATRLTYVPLEMANQFDDFIIKRDEEILDAVKARVKGYSAFSLLKLLYQLRDGPMTFTELYMRSNIRMKKSFLNYLHLCESYNFVSKETMGPYMEYSITEQGQTMIELFTHKNDQIE